MPVRSPDDVVHYDPNHVIWNAVADGLVDSIDVTASGRLCNNRSGQPPAPFPHNWEANVASTSPFGRQTRPFIFETPPRNDKRCENQFSPLSPPKPPSAPKRPARKALGNLTNSDEIEKHILCLELNDEEDAHVVSRAMLSRFLSVANDIENAQ